MKALIALALVVASTPALAAVQSEAASTASKKKICTRVERKGGSRMSMARVCLPAAEWRERLGPDWRENLSGTPSVDEQMEDVEARTKFNEGRSTLGRASRGPN